MENTTMADGQSMTVADVVARTMDGRLEDFVREAVALIVRELAEDYLAKHPVGTGVFLILVARAPATVWKVSPSGSGVIRNLEKTGSPLALGVNHR